MLVCASCRIYCTRDRGCSAHPVFPAPSDFHWARFLAKLRADHAARTQTHIQLSSSALCAIAHWGGRPSIPETLVMESNGRGVLDTPHARGMTGVWGFALSS